MYVGKGGGGGGGGTLHGGGLQVAHSLDDLCHWSGCSLSAVDQRRSEVEDEVSKQRAGVFAEKHLAKKCSV